MKLQRHRRVKRWSKQLTIMLSILCILFVVVFVILLRGREDREQAIAIGNITQQVLVAGERYYWGNDYVYPRTNDELQSKLNLSYPLVASSFRVTANSANRIGGYSYFVLEGVNDKNQLKDYNHIAVSYAEPPTWQEVQWTRLVERFDKSAISENWYYLDWAVNSSPSLDWIGGGCGVVQAYLARGMTYQQVLDELQADNDQIGNDCKVVDYN